MAQNTKTVAKKVDVKLKRNSSLPVFSDPNTVKDSAKHEMILREKFEASNKSINRHISMKDPLVTIPDEKLQILDMMPRLDIIEDQFFRKSIPKSTKRFKLRKNFSDMNDKKTTSTNFMNNVIKENLNAAKERDIKFCMRSNNIIDRNPSLLETETSKSTKVSKSTMNSWVREKIFGGIPPYMPEGTPLIQLLRLLSEDQLYSLNQKICKTYQ